MIILSIRHNEIVTKLFINPLVLSVLYIARTFGQNFYFNLERDPQKISYEHRDYESVDEKSLS